MIVAEMGVFVARVRVLLGQALRAMLGVVLMIRAAEMRRNDEPEHEHGRAGDPARQARRGEPRSRVSVGHGLDSSKGAEDLESP